MLFRHVYRLKIKLIASGLEGKKFIRIQIDRNMNAIAPYVR